MQVVTWAHVRLCRCVSASHAVLPANVSGILMAFNHMQLHYAPALAEQLGKFPALKHLDVSANPGLRCPGASLILSAVSGKILLAAHSLLHYFLCDC